jgi:hypothetical protein
MQTRINDEVRIVLKSGEEYPKVKVVAVGLDDIKITYQTAKRDGRGNFMYMQDGRMQMELHTRTLRIDNIKELRKFKNES